MQLQQSVHRLTLYFLCALKNQQLWVGVVAVQGMPDQDLYDSQESVEYSK